MKLIIECDPEHFVEASAIIQREAAGFAKYTKIGWGWSFGPYGWPENRSRFFVRRIKDGLSLKQSVRKSKPGITEGEKGCPSV